MDFAFTYVYHTIITYPTHLPSSLLVCSARLLSPLPGQYFWSISDISIVSVVLYTVERRLTMGCIVLIVRVEAYIYVKAPRSFQPVSSSGDLAESTGESKQVIGYSSIG